MSAPTPQISRLDHATDQRPKPTTPREMIDLIKGDTLRVQVEAIRIKYQSVLAATNSPSEAKKAVKAMKEKLPCIMWSGLFQRRGDANLEKHSGLLCADLDHLDEHALEPARAKLSNDPHAAVIFTSPTGSGLKVVFRVPADAATHRQSFEAVKHHIREITGLRIDPACSNAERLCFASHDPNTHDNPAAAELPIDLDENLIEPVEAGVVSIGTITAPPNGRPKASREKVEASLKAIPSDDYGQWINKGIALKREYGEEGFAMWTEWSRKSPKFEWEACREKWPTLKADERPNPIGVGTIIHDARQADEETLQRLAQLSVIDYDRIREDEARKLKIRTGTLDRLVMDRRPEQPRKAAGDDLGLKDPECWPDPVDGGEVLAEISDTFSRYLALPDGAADVLALWTAHTHCFEAFIHTPRLNLFSPEKGCGKTTAIDVIAPMVPRALRTESITAAVLFRLVELHKPILLLDECDAYLDNAEELRGLLNAGHKRGARAYRCEGDDHAVKAYNAFAPAVLAGIGSLPGTLHDRSIVVRLQRAKPGEVQQRFDSRRTAHEQDLCRKLARWIADHLDEIGSLDPGLPAGAFNRLADNWRPLFAIAQTAGPEWRNMAERSFALLTSQDDSDAHGLGVMLLTDIATIYEERQADRIFSKKLVEALIAMSDRPWPEAKGVHGKPITETWLANRLRAFGVHPKTMRVETERAKGYAREEFSEAFARFLPEPPQQAVTP
jgi:putative DNA primase/helicase